jgi:hypothetical protein
MTPWQPTHAAPDGGMAVWTTPDGANAPTDQLAAGTPVQVLETIGPWSRIVCSNGFTGWVDHHKLAVAGPAPAPTSSVTPVPVAGPPVGASSPGRSSIRLAAAVFVALVVAVGIAVVLTRSDSDGGDRAASDPKSESDSSSATDGTIATSAINLHVPAGWTISPDGTEAAENEIDLGAAAPSGAVVRAFMIEPDAETSDLLTGLTDGLEGDDLVFEEPATTDVDGFSAVSITTHGPDRVRAFVTVHPPGAAAVLFRLDAPADRFDSLRATLESVPGVGTD